MNWFKVNFRLADISAQREFYNHCSKLYSENNKPDNIKLYQADPGYYVDYYISMDEKHIDNAKDFLEKYNAVKVDKPDMKNVFLSIGRKKKKESKIQVNMDF